MTVLSIAIPSYNYGRYLGLAIESCLACTDDFELVVLDNASTDNTDSLRSRFIMDKRVRWHRNEKVLPIQDNWNRAVELARTPWVKVLQADDLLMPGAVGRLLKIIQENPDACYHAHLSVVIDEHGKEIRRQAPYRRSLKSFNLGPGEGVALKLRQIARLKEPTSNLYRKEAWAAVGRYRSDMRFAFDIAFNVELMARFQGVLWSEYLTKVRRHGASDGAKLPAQLAIDDLRKLTRKMVQYSPGAANERAAIAWVQYRSIELVAQRLRSRPGECVRLLLKNAYIYARADAWPEALQMGFRKFRTKDIQKTVD